MSRLIFAVLMWTFFACATSAQEVPGRDLLEFPLGALAAPRALATTAVGSFWNPALGALAPSIRADAGFAALTTPIDQGVTGELVAASAAVGGPLTASFSFATVGVSGLLRTETDPQSLGDDIEYQTTVASAGLAARWQSVSVGFAIRRREGTLDTDQRHVVAADFGFVIDSFGRLPIRLAGSTFMFAPGVVPGESATFLGAADVPIVRGDSTFSARAGISMSATQDRGSETYAFTSAAYRRIDLGAGIARTLEFGSSRVALGLGLGFQQGRYHVAISREDGSAGLGASYQFLLSSVFK